MVKNIHLLNGHMLQMQIGMASMRPFQQYMLLNLRKSVLKYTLNKYFGFPLLNISNCQSILKYLNCLHDSYIT